MKNLHISFELPTVLATQAGLNVANANQEIQRMLALFLYEHQRISLGKACEIGGLNYWEFADLNRQLRIPLHYSREELEEDMARLSHV